MFLKLTLGFALIFGATARADQLALYVIPSPFGMTWKSPYTLARSALLNTVAFDWHETRHDTGHVAVGLECEGRHVLAGVTGADDSESYDLLVRKKIGLGILFHAFQGRLQSTEELERDLKRRQRDGSMSFLRFQISRETCRRLATFLSEFQAHPSDLRYGLSLRPRHREGSGSSAFAIAFLELAGLFSQEMKSQWSRRVFVPEELIGEPKYPVRISKILSWHAWGTPERPNQLVYFFDPDLMHKWITKTWHFIRQGHSSNFEVHKTGGTLGLIRDAQDVPTPTEPIWL